MGHKSTMGDHRQNNTRQLNTESYGIQASHRKNKDTTVEFSTYYTVWLTHTVKETNATPPYNAMFHWHWLRRSVRVRYVRICRTQSPSTIVASEYVVKSPRSLHQKSQ